MTSTRVYDVVSHKIWVTVWSAEIGFGLRSLITRMAHKILKFWETWLKAIPWVSAKLVSNLQGFQRSRSLWLQLQNGGLDSGFFSLLKNPIKYHLMRKASNISSDRKLNKPVLSFGSALLPFWPATSFQLVPHPWRLGYLEGKSGIGKIWR